MMRILLLAMILASLPKISTSQTTQWDSIKTATKPVVAPAFADSYTTPFRQALNSYGWEDGIHISRDGLHLYALYYPGDLLSWNLFFGENVTDKTFCELFGDTTFLRPYAPDYGMDMTTNAFGCDQFMNIDIVYAHRTAIGDPFTQWQLSGMAMPGEIEGGAYPLFSATDDDAIDIFLFTGNNDIRMIRNTTANPGNAASATRLPTTINPETDEFNVDNPCLERLGGDTLLLVYEKYTNGDERVFMYALSNDYGQSWQTPVALTSIHYSMGKIEHPHLYQNVDGTWYLYFSLNCEIYRSQQGIEGDWDSWLTPELIIEKGNAACVGEPSVTEQGDISFAVVYHANTANNDTTDTYDIDPWLLPKNQVINTVADDDRINNASVYPNPFGEQLFVETHASTTEVTIVDQLGNVVLEKSMGNKNKTITTETLKSGLYFIHLRDEHSSKTVKMRKF